MQPSSYGARLQICIFIFSADKVVHTKRIKLILSDFSAEMEEKIKSTIYFLHSNLQFLGTEKANSVIW